MERDDDVEHTAELLRLALPVMARHGSSMNPINYALWYTYVSGAIPDLVEDVQQELQHSDPLADAQVRALFDRHVNEYGFDTIRQVRDDLAGVMDHVTRSTRESRAHTEAFEGALTQHATRLRQRHSPEEVDSLVAMLLQDTEAMRGNVSTLHSQLENAVSEVGRLHAELERARAESLRDPLTGIPNRRAFDAALQQALSAEPKHPDRGCCLLLIDIDHFKRINDTYGHMLGDRVIVAVARVLQKSVSAGQTAARYGGEEFAIVMPEASRGQARALAERVRVEVARGRVRRRDRGDTIGQVTVSVGVCVPPVERDPKTYLRIADEALYAAKDSGRNCVTLYPNARVGHPAGEEKQSHCG